MLSRSVNPPGTAGGSHKNSFSVDPAGRLDPASAVRPVVPAADRPDRAVDPAFADHRRLAGRPDRHLGFAELGATDTTLTNANASKFPCRASGFS
jgi:hypothetical protein